MVLGPRQSTERQHMQFSSQRWPCFCRVMELPLCTGLSERRHWRVKHQQHRAWQLPGGKTHNTHFPLWKPPSAGKAIAWQGGTILLPGHRWGTHLLGHGSRAPARSALKSRAAMRSRTDIQPIRRGLVGCTAPGPAAPAPADPSAAAAGLGGCADPRGPPWAADYY